ncbi:FAD-binding oxidoreductase [Winogradskyella sp.]|jgi:glycine/D-amino acid oxidase-like deaminating enzyme|uniref:NAD(P)/FAD-dependent oxidoreductase n=1 Tax=Winogradskyella sp. TaxID=1883156 RepID=UPI0025EE4731|nr:FAD-dependent oxidoreductase [Winogradskyella sp.]MCT4628893.1 FAD-dependent oxidoreductase [Winogradskyella sp.]
MKKVNYIIVGCGLAGIAFCEQLRANSKSFIVFDDNSQKSSIVAAALYNPVILKRFSEVWKAQEQLEAAIPFYNKIEKTLNIQIDYKLQLLRRFTSIEEQNLWFNASDKPKLEPFLSTQLVKNTNEAVDAPFGYGEVLHAGRLDTKTLISAYKADLLNKGFLETSKFEYDNLIVSPNKVQYNAIEAKQIVFADGFGLKKNPFFNHLPLNGTKGEVLIIKSSNLKIDFGIKSSVFIIPVKDDLYAVGATYNWTDKTNVQTEEGKQELINKLKTFIKCDFEVVNHLAGIRPTVKDRRPLVGRHSQHQNLYVLNGLGTRGVMIAPYVADKLYRFVENYESLDSEIDINRFN